MSQIDTQPLQGETAEQTKPNYVKEVTAGLTVSFAALSLGAAFGDSSGRGAIGGVLSAGFLALWTSAIGGTVVQCSGPTAPMTAVTTTVVEYSTSDDFAKTFPDNNPALFVNMVMVLTAALLALMAICRMGQLIVFVPNVVVSGFMDGIAIMIWVPKVQELFGLGADKIEGNTALNTVLALTTTALIFFIPKLTAKFCAPIKAFLPGTLIAILLITVIVQVAGLASPLFDKIQKVKTGEPIDELSDVSDMFKENMPTEWSGPLIIKAIPYAIQLGLLGYIDTLLTSRIVDAKVVDMYPPQDRWRPTWKNLELIGQAAGNGFNALFGGIPGAQATIRSVLILNEGAMTRVAGLMAGTFTIIEIGLFSKYVAMIPQCVLTGVMFKVGYDCFDWSPFLIYINTMLLGKQHPGATDPSKAAEPVVTHAAFVFIVLTAILNSFFALHIVVTSGVIAYYVVNQFIMKIPDLEPYGDSFPDADVARDAEEAAVGTAGALPQRVVSGQVPTRTASTMERELSTDAVMTRPSTDAIGSQQKPN